MKLPGEDRRALRAFRRACHTGAPFTTKSHPLHRRMKNLHRAGIVKPVVVGSHTYWSLTDLGTQEIDR